MSLGNVLAVDDEQNIRRLIRNEFTLEGYEVTTAKSGEEGLALIERKQFDVVLLDIKLPKLNGLDVLRKIKEISNTTEVIMITGYGDIQTAVSSLKLGAMDYVTKPFKLDDLLTSVQKAVSDSKAKKPSGGGYFRRSVGQDEKFCPLPQFVHANRLSDGSTRGQDGPHHSYTWRNRCGQRCSGTPDT